MVGSIILLKVSETSGLQVPNTGKLLHLMRRDISNKHSSCDVEKRHNGGGGVQNGEITGQMEPVKGTHSWAMADETGVMRKTKPKPKHERDAPGQGNTRYKTRQPKQGNQPNRHEPVGEGLGGGYGSLRRDVEGCVLFCCLLCRRKTLPVTSGSHGKAGRLNLAHGECGNPGSYWWNNLWS